MPRTTTGLDKKIGKKIMELRLAKGLSREAIAKVVGVTHQQFTKYESGANRLSVTRLLEIADALKTDPSYFYSNLISEEHKSALDNPRLRMSFILD